MKILSTVLLFASLCFSQGVKPLPYGASSLALKDTLLNIVVDTPIIYTKGMGSMAKLNAVIASIGSAPVRMVVDKQISITANDTIPANVCLDFVKGQGFNIAANDTLVMGCMMPPGRYQVAFGSGVFAPSILAAPYYYPEWFGAFVQAAGAAAADQSAGMQRAINAAAKDDKRGLLKLSSGYYYVVALDMAKKPITMQGDNNGATTLRLWKDTSDMIKILNTTEVTGWTFRDLRFEGRDPTSGIYDSLYSAINADKFTLSTFDNCYFNSFGKGLTLNYGRDVFITKCVFGSNNQIGLNMPPSGTETNNMISDSWFDENKNKGIYVNCSRNTFTGCHFQDNTLYHVFIGLSGRFNRFVGCAFVKGATQIAIEFDGQFNSVDASDVDTAFSGSGFLIKPTGIGNIIRTQGPANNFQDSGINTYSENIWHGRIGINYQAPDFQFDISKAQSNSINIRGEGLKLNRNAGSGYILWGDSTEMGYWDFQRDPTGPLNLDARGRSGDSATLNVRKTQGGTAVLQVHATDGRVAINNSNAPSYNLDVTGDGRFTKHLRGNDSLTVDSLATLNKNIYFRKRTAPISSGSTSYGMVYIDSITANLATVNFGGTVNHAVQSTTAVPHQWMTALSDAGGFTLAQPAFTDISGTAQISQGGTGATTKTSAFDALSPMTSAGDLIYGGAAGTGSRLAIGTAKYVLRVNAAGTNVEWAADTAIVGPGGSTNFGTPSASSVKLSSPTAGAATTFPHTDATYQIDSANLASVFTRHNVSTANRVMKWIDGNTAGNANPTDDGTTFGITESLYVNKSFRQDSAIFLRNRIQDSAKAAPGTPPSGFGVLWFDSTNKILYAKDDAAASSHTAKTTTATSSQWFRSFADDGTFTKSQPAFTDISGTVTNAQIRNSGALSLIGRSANSSGAPADISAVAASDCVYHELSSTLECGTVRTAGIANQAVTFLKLDSTMTPTFTRAWVLQKNVTFNDSILVDSVLKSHTWIVDSARKAPGTPASGYGAVYFDSTNKVLSGKDDGGNVGHVFRTTSRTANQFATAFNADGTITEAAIAAADLPGSFNGFANPTASAGLSIINGSAATAMRSDGAPAIDQTIVPIWTGLHKFRQTVSGSAVEVAEFDNASNTASSDVYVLLANGGSSGGDAYIRWITGSTNWSFGAVNSTTFAFTRQNGLGGSQVFTVALTGIMTTSNTTDASSSTAGGFNVAGGIAVTKKANIGTVLTVGTSINTTNLLISTAAPTVSSGFGTGASITKNNGTLSFLLQVGTGGAASSGVIGLPTASNGWNCFCNDRTTNSTAVANCKQTASSTTTATITNYSNLIVLTAWPASDTLGVMCSGY